MGRTFDFIANSGDGVFAVDRHQSIVLWNKRATEILGFNRGETLGKKCYDIVCGRDARGCTVCRRGCAALASARQLQPAGTQDLTVQTKEGDEAWLNLSTVVVPSRRGDLSVLVHMFREVTRDHELASVAREFAEMVSGDFPKRKKNRRERAAGAATSLTLTPREREILTCLASGISTETIANELRISTRTVQNHISNVLGKLGAHSRLEAVAYSIKNGLM